MFDPVYISDINCVTPLGSNIAANWQALLQGESGIRRHHLRHLDTIYTSKFGDGFQEQEGFSFLESLLVHAVVPIVKDKTFTVRTGFILSSTKGNIEILAQGTTEGAELFRMAKKVAEHLGVLTRPVVVSHACVSGVLAVVVAKRLIQMGQFDEVLVVAGDQVSEFVVSGFGAFQAMSDEPCRPFDKGRKGVTLGEATAACWVTKRKPDIGMEIIGDGAINDANHISGPSRTGEGLYRSITAAFKEAGIEREDVDFISAHGTATLYNDEMEAIAFERAGLVNTPVQSLKGYYGHTLGASGLLELVIAMQSVLNNTLIPTKGYAENGTTKPIQIIQDIRVTPLSVVLKTASGFGGSNVATILKKVVH